MVRLLLLIAMAVVGGVALWKLYGMLRSRRVDWTGAGLFIAFVALAFWLRHETGVGGLAD